MSLEINSEKNSYSLSLKDLPRPQKMAVGFLFILAIFIVVFWVWQIRAQINRPFAYEAVSNTATSTDIAEVLKKKDTDGDGVSDYDEIYVYKTSPYLEDSDSDGLSDKKEVDQGSDPNCAPGKDCSASLETATSTSEIPSPTLISPSTLSLPAELVGSSSVLELQNALNGQADAVTLRKLLIASGANSADLDKISDSDLMKSYQESLKKQNNNPPNNQ